MPLPPPPPTSSEATLDDSRRRAPSGLYFATPPPPKPESEQSERRQTFANALSAEGNGGRGERGGRPEERARSSRGGSCSRALQISPPFSFDRRASEDEAVAFNRHASGAQPRLSRSRNLAARARRLSLTLWWRETSVLHVDRSGDKWRRCRRGLLLLLLSLDQR